MSTFQFSSPILMTWVSLLLVTLFTQTYAQDLICTALPGASAANPAIDDTWCNKTCFAAGAPQQANYVAVFCISLAGDAQVCQCTLPPVDCVGTLSAFSDCSVSCGGGTQTATFTVITPAQNGGKECPYADQAQVVQACNQQSCPSTAFLCLPIPNTGSNQDWCSTNCWAPGVTDRTLDNVHPGCTTVGGRSQVCICNLIGSPSLQCLAIPSMGATDDWCAKNCWVDGQDQTLANLVNYCTTAGGASQVCSCDQFGP